MSVPKWRLPFFLTINILVSGRTQLCVAKRHITNPLAVFQPREPKAKPVLGKAKFHRTSLRERILHNTEDWSPVHENENENENEKK